MKTKETICTEYDARGRVIKRTTTVEVFDTDMDQEPDGVGYGRNGGLHRASTKRIHEAIEDYLMSNQW